MPVMETGVEYPFSAVGEGFAFHGTIVFGEPGDPPPPPPLVEVHILPETLPNLQVGQPISQLLTATGGEGPYDWAVAVGALPSGTQLTDSGMFAGAPTQAGDYSFTVEVVDVNGDFGERTYTGAVASAIKR